jgi:hypothetical protein
MERKILRLIQPVTVTGQPIFGRYEAKATLSPVSRSQTSWQLISPNSHCAIPIKAANLDLAWFQNLAVDCGADGSWAHVLEHLLVLKWFGLVGVNLESTHCLPFTGSPRVFVDQVLPACQGDIVDLPVKTVSREIYWEYPRKRGGEKAYTKIVPRDDGRLSLNVAINYSGLGEVHRTYEFPNEPLLEKITETCSQGWPPRRYWQSVLGRSFGLWDHHEHVEWPKEFPNSSLTLQRFVDHRAVDLLGILASLLNGAWLSADVYSVCSGHQADLQVCQIAGHHLMTLPL